MVDDHNGIDQLTLFEEKKKKKLTYPPTEGRVN